jgi:PIN domain nuclease of toxin-antitoxin system
VSLLLDTCTLVWALFDPAELSRRSREAITGKEIGEEPNVIFVSAASAWEIATKVRTGKFPEAEPLERRFLEIMDEAGFTLLSIDASSALRAGRLPAPHRDPFDRMIAAQALSLDIPVLSPDTRLDQFGVRRIW